MGGGGKGGEGRGEGKRRKRKKGKIRADFCNEFPPAFVTFFQKRKRKLFALEPKPAF